VQAGHPVFDVGGLGGDVFAREGQRASRVRPLEQVVVCLVEFAPWKFSYRSLTRLRFFDKGKVISLMKCMESQLEELLAATLESYRATLAAMGDASIKAYPHTGQSLQEGLINLSQQLTSSAGPSTIVDAGREVAAELDDWSSQAGAFFKHKALEVKEIMKIVGATAQSVAERDERYATEFQQIGDSMHKIADLDDISEIRRSLVKHSAGLKSCVARMAEDGRESIAKMRLDLADYQVRLEETERAASTDALTGLANRRGVERQLTHFERQRQPFCVMMFDLNRFKFVNDRYGHQAGDVLLKQFAHELGSIFRPTDVIGRWGGDEFIVLLGCTLAVAQARIKSIREWVFGDYVLETNGERIRLRVGASVGLAEWDGVEPISRLIERADTEMYEHKAEMKRSAT
jgi:diguanylate cyclase (GGDEF)-like protein